MTAHNLVFKAGPGAFDSIRRHGFSPEQIGTIAGASGGAKWLVLSQLDRCILENIVPKLDGPVHLLGSSIGAWRFACYAQNDPVDAIDRFEQAYIGQSYSEKPDIHEITKKSREIAKIVFGGQCFRPNTVTPGFSDAHSDSKGTSCGCVGESYRSGISAGCRGFNECAASKIARIIF